MLVQTMLRKMTPFPRTQVVGLALESHLLSVWEEDLGPYEICISWEAFIVETRFKPGFRWFLFGPEGKKNVASGWEIISKDRERTVGGIKEEAKQSCNVYGGGGWTFLLLSQWQYSLPLQAYLSLERPGLRSRECQLVLAPSPSR